ncbi:hypothetical protein ACOTVS_10500 [Aliarcobacter butzleri]
MITMVGTGVIINIQNKNKYKIVTLDDLNGTILYLKLPSSFSYKKVLLLNERVNFLGDLNEDGIVEIKNLSRAYLEPIGFKFSTDNENIFTYVKKGEYIQIEVEAPNFREHKKTFIFLGKIVDDEVLEKVLNYLGGKKISFEGFFRKNIGVLTKIEKAL